MAIGIALGRAGARLTVRSVNRVLLFTKHSSYCAYVTTGRQGMGIVLVLTFAPDAIYEAWNRELADGAGGFEQEPPEPLEADVLEGCRGFGAVAAELFVVEGAALADEDAMGVVGGQVGANPLLERKAHAHKD